MVSNKNVATAVGGKTSRACDSCVRKRARWYCAADDAFLCQLCDSYVHSANLLSRRHERVRLKTSSLKGRDEPCWHHGFKKKARSPRGKSKRGGGGGGGGLMNNPFLIVPEVGVDEIYSIEENDEEQLVYRVPVFDNNFVDEAIARESSKVLVAGYGQDVDNLDEFLSPDMDLDFAADFKRLLGGELGNESCGMEELRLMDCKEDSNSMEDGFYGGRVKSEEKEGYFDAEMEMDGDPFKLNLDDYDEEDMAASIKGSGDDGEKEKAILLRLDYDAVISAWASQGCHWTTNGTRPELKTDTYWPYCTGAVGKECREMGGGYVGYGYGYGYGDGDGDGGREARVMRYREKRRTRLFSKKIRYEVRKLNAEKRPRMKGRFVKRISVSIAAPPAFSLLQ